MNYLEIIEEKIKSGGFSGESTDLLSDVVKSVLGDPIAIAKVLVLMSKSPFLIKEKIFWAKVEMFLNGVIRTDEDKDKLRKKITEYGKNEENAYRLIKCIDEAETKRKIQYIVNATRCFLADFIEAPDFYRICNAVVNTLDEDLNFLKNHIFKENMPYNLSVQGLLSNGLMYQSELGDGCDGSYSFTQIALLVDKFAISYDNVDRYPNPKSEYKSETIPKTAITTIVLEPISKEEIENILK